MPALSVIPDNAPVPLPRRQADTVSVSSSGSSSRRAAAERARLELVEAEHQAAEAAMVMHEDAARLQQEHARKRTAVLMSGIEVQKQKYQLALAESDGSRRGSRAGSVTSMNSGVTSASARVKRPAILRGSDENMIADKGAGLAAPQVLSSSSSSSSRPHPAGAPLAVLQTVHESVGAPGKPGHQQTQRFDLSPQRSSERVACDVLANRPQWSSRPSHRGNPGGVKAHQSGSTCQHKNKNV